MKGYLAICFFLLFSAVSKADIPNPYFEKWTPVGTRYDGPVGWETNSRDLSSAVSHTHGAYKGSRALVLTSEGLFEAPGHTSLTVDALSFEYAPPEVRFYPNPVTQNDPANDYAILEFRGYNSDDLQLMILSADGRQHHLLTNPEDNYFRIESMHLAKGLYFYHLYNGQNPVQTGKFVI